MRTRYIVVRLAMILLSMLPAVPGVCALQDPVLETSDPYFSAALEPQNSTPILEQPAQDDGSAAGELNRLSMPIVPPAQGQAVNSNTSPTPSNPRQPEAVLASAETARDTFEPGRVLAIVGGRPILVGDMLYEINERIEQVIPTAPAEIKEQQRERLYSAWLARYIDQQLLYTDVVRGLPAEADLDKMFDSIGETFDEEALPDFLKKQSLVKTLDFDMYLRSHGSSLRRFRQRWIEDQFIRYFVSQKFADKYEPTHAEMYAYYQEHLADFSHQARARWEQLVVRFDKTPDKETARRQIAEMGNEVVYGAKLEAVAKERSHDVLASEGGQQGWVHQGSLADKLLDETIFSIPLGELSDIVESKVGYHIIRVHERVPAGAKPFHEAQVQIREKLVEQHRAEQLEEYLTRLRREIPIEVVDTSVTLPEGYRTE